MSTAGEMMKNAIRILRAVFRALILDWHARCSNAARATCFIFSTTNSGNKVSRQAADGRTLKRDHHGGGYHGGWGGASRMRIYEELVRQNMLTEAEQARMKKIVHQSLSPTFLNFKSGPWHADNHSFGNGGVALGIKLFPDAPQVKEARAWLDRIWNHLADFGDWTEWNYYPYGPIFLHGLVDIAEATGRLELEKELIDALGRRCLQLAHGGGVRGGQIAARQRTDFRSLRPLERGLLRRGDVQPRCPFLVSHGAALQVRYLWAAEQVSLGGCPPGGNVPPQYQAAYNKRFAWFVERGIEPRVPKMQAKVGLLSELKRK